MDFDQQVFEVYEGFQKERPKAGRWKGSPTAEEDEGHYMAHLEYAKKAVSRADPEVSEYKAIELVGNCPSTPCPPTRSFSASDTETVRRRLRHVSTDGFSVLRSEKGVPLWGPTQRLRAGTS